MSGHWWDEPFGALQTNLREIDAACLDVESVLDYLGEYGADTWLISVGGIIANYPSELDCQRVNPALAARASGDLIGDAVAAAERRGVRVLGRMDFSKIDAPRSEEHPEWCFVGPSGEPQIYNGYHSVCPSGQYYQQEMFNVVSEVLSRYDIRGFFFNMMHFNERDYSRRYHGVCHCESCLTAFRQYAPQVAHPTGPDSPGYVTWRTFTENVLEDLNRRLSEHIRSLSPDAALILKDGADVTYFEANNAVGRTLWHLATAESVSASRTADPERAVFVNCVGFVDMPYRWAGEDPHHFAQYFVQAMAHGGRPSTYVMGTPDVGNYEGLAIGGVLTRFYRDNSDIYRGLRSTAGVGLVRGSNTKDAYAERRLAEFRGCYQSLVERHVPFDVVRQDQLAAADTNRYALLVLPDLGHLAPEEVAAVEAFLAAGGAVVATGDSGWRRGKPQIGSDAPLAQQKASYATATSLFSLHVPVDDSGDNAPVLGAFGVLEPAANAEVDWQVLGRSLYGPPEKCYGNRPMPHPGWVAGDVGAGRLAFLPWRPGQVYYELGLQRVRDAWVDKALGLTSQPDALKIETDLPDQMQVVTGRNRTGTEIIHLLNRSGDASQRFMKPLPIGPGVLRIPVRGEPQRVRARVADADLRWSIRGGQLEIEMPAVDLFEVIELRGAPTVAP